MNKTKIVRTSVLSILVICLMFALLAISASAAEQDTIVFGCGEFDSVRGETFTTTVCVQEGSGVTGLDLSLSFNEEYVSLVNYKSIHASQVNVIDNTIIINYAGADNINTVLQLVELTFKVDENLNEGLYSNWLTWTSSEDDSAFTTTGFSGGIPQYKDLTITTDFEPLFIRKRGDAYNNNYDGKINARDASYILQHTAHMFTMSEVDQRYANAYNKDDPTDGIKISARDASIVLQYAAHMGVELSDRVTVTFYSLDSNGDYVVQVVKSVKKGNGLTNLPAVPYKEGTQNCSWSASNTSYVEPTFSNITANINVYAHYEKQDATQPENTNKLATPVISGIEYDTISWSPIPNADYYTVRVNDNYECTLRGTTCSLKDVKWNGSPISTYGNVSVTVWANGHGDYESSNCSDLHTSYFYVPETNSETAEKLIAHSIGFGYNLIEDDYLDITKCSSKSVFNVAKLLTIGNYTARNHSGGEGETYSYSSVDEFISKTKIGFEYGQETGCALLGSVKMQINANVGFDFRKYSYNETYVYEYNWTYKDHVITNFSEYDLLKYCLSDTFVKDLKKESISTQAMTDEQLVEYLFNTYGTHAILGITTGGKYEAQYRISTNEQDIAAQVKVAFNMSTGGGSAIDQIIQKDFGIKVDVQEDLSWSTDTTEAKFTTKIYGGSGGGATSSKSVEDAIQDWTASLNEDNARSIAFTDDGAIAISNLIAFIDGGLANKFSAYIDERSDETYDELYSQYTKPTSLPMNVTVENGKNVLHIDLSAYQTVGSLENAYSPNLLNNVLTVYPTMFGKRINVIHITGGFDSATANILIDNLSIKLPNTWNRDVEIIIDNLGVISNSNAGFVDVSDITKNIQISTTYRGLNIIQTTSGEYNVFSEINSDKYSYKFTLLDSETIDFTSARIENGILYLPTASKASFDFVGWYDEFNNQITDSLGKVVATDTAEGTYIYAKWVPNVFKITLDAQGATNTGTKEFYEQYTVGFFTEYEGVNSISKITIPKRTGYVFGGYYASVANNATAKATGNTQYIDAQGNIVAYNVAFAKNTTITALWIPKVVTINLDSQSATTQGTNTIYQQYKTGVFSDNNATTIVNTIVPPEREGYIFAGYYLNVSNNGTSAATGEGMVVDAEGRIVISSDYSYTEDFTVKALWTAVYTIKLDNQNALVKGSAQYYQKYGEGIFNEVQCFNEMAKIVVPERIGFTFGGYFESVTNNATTSANGVNQRIKADGTIVASATQYTQSTTLYALWIPKTYSVNYSLFNQSNESNIINVECINGTNNANKIIYSEGLVLNNPTRSEYDRFVGWYADASFTTPITESWWNNWYANPSNITFYAKWNLAVYYTEINSSTNTDYAPVGDRNIIVVDMSVSEQDLSNGYTCLNVDSTVEKFVFIGKGSAQVYYDYHINSNAATTVIKNVDTSDYADMVISSPNVVLENVVIKNTGGCVIPLKLTAENTNLVVNGTVTLYSTCYNIDGLVANNLTIKTNDASAILNVTGGGQAINVVSSLTIDGKIAVTATAGTGAAGSKGHSPSDTGNGGRGTDGSAGFIGIKANAISILNGATVNAYGGTGGRGGDGGNSRNKYWGSKNDAGNGATGGTGGVAIQTTSITIDENSSVNAYGGTGGRGGDGGLRDTRYGNGSKGSGGSGGSGGFAINADAVINGNITTTNGSSGGSGSTGGDWKSG